MPLLITAIAFNVLFILEFAWSLSGQTEAENALRRYQETEHPHFRTTFDNA